MFHHVILCRSIFTILIFSSIIVLTQSWIDISQILSGMVWKCILDIPPLVIVMFWLAPDLLQSLLEVQHAWLWLLLLISEHSSRANLIHKLRRIQTVLRGAQMLVEWADFREIRTVVLLSFVTLRWTVECSCCSIFCSVVGFHQVWQIDSWAIAIDFWQTKSTHALSLNEFLLIVLF